MNREEFLKKLSATALLGCTCGLAACSSDSEPTPSVFDFTLDLSQSQNAALNTPGGSVTVDGIIIARLSTIEFAALSRACTHAGTPVNFRFNEKDFLCPNHGSIFSTNGSVVRGPAVSPLRQFNTELNGNLLRVFS